MTGNTEKQGAFLKALIAKDGNITKACKSVKIARSTYYEWLDRSDDFRQKKEGAIEELYDFVESKLIEQIREGNTTAIIFYAKTKMKSRGYVERQEIEATGTSKPITVIYRKVVKVGD